MAKDLWYAAQVRTGSEESVRRQCLDRTSHGVLKDCCVFYYEEKKHIRGEWVIQERLLFPGYVFFVAKEGYGKETEEELRNIDGVRKLLRIGDEPAALTGEEVDFLKELGGKAQTVEMSEGIIEQSVIKVYSGPLVGKEKYIRKIDRHKRRAMLEMPMFGEMRKMQVGLEIVAKS